MVIQQYEKAKAIQDEQLERLTQICQEQGVMQGHSQFCPGPSQAENARGAQSPPPKGVRAAGALWSASSSGPFTDTWGAQGPESGDVSLR